MTAIVSTAVHQEASVNYNTFPIESWGTDSEGMIAQEGHQLWGELLVKGLTTKREEFLENILFM